MYCNICSEPSKKLLQRAGRYIWTGVRILPTFLVASSKAFALTWYRALTWYSSPARPFAAPDVPLLVTGQQGRPSLACRQPSRARNACAGGSSDDSTKLKHGTKLGPTLCYEDTYSDIASGALQTYL